MIHYAERRWRAGEKLPVSPGEADGVADPECLTTLRIHGGRPAFLKEHLHRLCFESRELGLSLPDAQRISTVLAAGILKNRLERGVSRIVWPGSRPGNSGSGLSVTFEGLRPLPRGATLLLASTNPSKWRTIKSIAVKEALPLWHRAREQHCFDVLMQNEGDLLEASTGNLFLFRSGHLSTPCADGRILPGITRALVLEQTALEAVERHHNRAWLKRVEACFITNCARGIIPVARIVTENGQLVWEGDPRHRVILETRKHWRRAMIASAANLDLSNS